MSVNASGLLHTDVPLDWWDDAFRLSVTVPRSKAWISKAQRPLKGSKLKDWHIKPSHLTKDFGEWTLGLILNSPGPGESITYLWDPPLTSLVTAAPGYTEQLVKTKSTSEPYFWPNVMLDGFIVKDKRLVASGGIGNFDPVYRGRWVKGRNLPTITRTLTYVSYQQPPDSLLKCSVPDEQEIIGDANGVPINIPPCLHPYVEMISSASSDAVLQDITPRTRRRYTGEKLIYQPTKHQRWITHISAIDAIEEGSLWKRVVTIRKAPFMPAPTYGVS
jgi:hypothetical protein